MKKIIKPAVREEAIYYSDFSGKTFGEFHPPVELKISFGYNSSHDGAEISLHLDDEEVSSIIELIKSKISEDFKQHKKKIIERFENDYEDSMQMRDWDRCDHIYSNLTFWRNFLGVNEEIEK